MVMVTSLASPTGWGIAGVEGWPAERREAVLGVLAQSGFGASTPGALHLFDAVEALRQPPPPEVQAVLMVDGALGAEHAAHLERTPPSLLLAAREDGGTPSGWEAALLHRLLSGADLLPLPPERCESQVLDRIADLHRIAERAGSLARGAGGGRNAAELCADVTYELAANALLDAPVDGEGRERYAHRRDEVDRVEAEDAISVHLGVDGGLLFIQAIDRFGRLGTRPFIRVLQSLGNRAALDVAGGGAGLGMRRMLEHSDACAVRVTPGRQTRVLCVVNLGEARRRAAHPKSLLFHVDRG